LFIRLQAQNFQKIAVKHSYQEILVNGLLTIAGKILQLKATLYLLDLGLNRPALKVELFEHFDSIFAIEQIGGEVFVLASFQSEAKDTDKQFFVGIKVIVEVNDHCSLLAGLKRFQEFWVIFQAKHIEQVTI
jgi:hypothetical protein